MIKSVSYKIVLFFKVEDFLFGEFYTSFLPWFLWDSIISFTSFFHFSLLESVSVS